VKRKEGEHACTEIGKNAKKWESKAHPSLPLGGVPKGEEGPSRGNEKCFGGHKKKRRSHDTTLKWHEQRYKISRKLDGPVEASSKGRGAGKRDQWLPLKRKKGALWKEEDIQDEKRANLEPLK